MAMTSVHGEFDLAETSARLKELGNKGLGRQLGIRLKQATRSIEPLIKQNVEDYMPSGYAPILAPSLVFKTTVRTTRITARVVYSVYGDGQAERRDIPALNNGILRHPVFGRRKQAWHNTRVRAGFVDDAIEKHRPQVDREMQKVLQWVDDQIGG